jgi:hypothetical protein
MAPRLKRSHPLGEPNTELAQTRISETADALLEAKAQAEALTKAGYLRRLIYRDVGLLDKV